MKIRDHAIMPLPFSPLIYAELAENTYYPEKRADLPPGFYLFNVCPPKERRRGYSSKTFFTIDESETTLNVFIAHRGTDNLEGIVEDLEMWINYWIPEQYESCAVPYMKQTLADFQAYAQAVYPGYTINYQVTGHSLGATLAQKTIQDPNFHGLFSWCVLFENPGLPPNQIPWNVEEIANKIVLINTVPDAINTFLKTPSHFQYHLPINNQFYPRIFGVPLPFIPSLVYYGLAYSFGVAHPIAGIVKALSTTPLLPIEQWPYGLMNGFETYKDTTQNPGYWDGYIYELWNNNGLESDIVNVLFDFNFSWFYSFYNHYFLNHGLQASPEYSLAVFENINLDNIWQKLDILYQIRFENIEHFKFEVNRWRANLAPQLENARVSPIRSFFSALPPSAPADIPEPSAPIDTSLFTQEGMIKSYDPTSTQNQVTSKNHSQYSIFTVGKQVFSTEDYKNALTNYLDERIKNLPEHKKKEDLRDIKTRLAQKESLTIPDIKEFIQCVRVIVAEHRDTEGLKGFFTSFRSTNSLSQLNKLFDDNNNLIDQKNVYYNVLQFK